MHEIQYPHYVYESTQITSIDSKNRHIWLAAKQPYRAVPLSSSGRPAPAQPGLRFRTSLTARSCSRTLHRSTHTHARTRTTSAAVGRRARLSRPTTRLQSPADCVVTNRQQNADLCLGYRRKRRSQHSGQTAGSAVNEATVRSANSCRAGRNTGYCSMDKMKIVSILLQRNTLIQLQCRRENCLEDVATISVQVFNLFVTIDS